MKNSSLITKERVVILSVGLLILVVGAIYRFSPDLSIFSVSEKMDRVVKYQKRAGDLAGLEDRNIFLTSHVERLSGVLISAGSNELAGAKIQGLLKEMARKGNIGLISIKTQKPDEKAYKYLSVIPVKLTFKSTVGQLRDIIFEIETSQKLLAVSELRVIKPSGKETEDLNVIMTVQGFSKKQG
ncbi:GspMb/PilO family protein [uncultured Desulfobacter sp.]|uniref:GspMb/PilO family protein n=1 Tax=uncultured Desulfobacter sp. TaxID=240139 RepID=UPI002AAB19FE|nr:GspMb/PilO family protein [uncultured Desulfobacter sp.]